MCVKHRAVASSKSKLRTVVCAWCGSTLVRAAQLRLVMFIGEEPSLSGSDGLSSIEFRLGVGRGDA